MARTSARATVTARQPEIPAGRCYLCIGPNVWGKAFTAEQAWDNAGKPAKFVMFDAPPDAYVDGMGSITCRPALYYKGEAQYFADVKEPQPEGEPDRYSGDRFVPIGYRARELYRYGVK